MNKIIMVILISLSTMFTTDAQDSYYYYRGSKTPLKVDKNKVAVAFSKANQERGTFSSDLAFVDSIVDSRTLIKIYEVDASSKKNKLYPETPESGELLACYKTESGQELTPNGYINVKLKNAGDYPLLTDMAKLYNLDIVEQNKFMPLWYNLYLDVSNGGNPVEVANELYESGCFEFSFPSFSFNALEISYDPDVKRQWNLYNRKNDMFDISISKAWGYATGRGVKIAIIDEGIDMNHIDLADNIYPLSYDTETGTSPSRVYGDHGTHCAGIAAAVRNNGKYIAGVAPDAKLMSVSSTLRGIGVNLETKLADGINWAWENGADVLSCSWLCYENDTLDEAINNAVFKGRSGKGCIFVNSAGNVSLIHPTHDITYPGYHSENVLAVSNMTIDGILEEKSCYGPNLFVTAPGTDILSTIPNNRVKWDKGTSMACPHVAGLAALILERDSSLTAEEVRRIIAENTVKIGDLPYSSIKKYGSWNEKYGYGLIDAYRSVKATPKK